MKCFRRPAVGVFNSIDSFKYRASFNHYMNIEVICNYITGVLDALESRTDVRNQKFGINAVPHSTYAAPMHHAFKL